MPTTPAAATVGVARVETAHLLLVAEEAADAAVTTVVRRAANEAFIVLCSGRDERSQEHTSSRERRSSIAIRQQRKKKVQREKIITPKASRRHHRRHTHASRALDHAPNALLDCARRVVWRESTSKRSASKSNDSLKTRRRPKSARDPPRSPAR